MNGTEADNWTEAIVVMAAEKIVRMLHYVFSKRH
jgi:hypothetical protein